MKGRIAYRLPPAGPAGVRSNLWTWSLVMNTHSRRKDAAWQLIEWAAGPAFLRRSAFEGNMNPTRRSAWDDARFLELASAWGDFASVARQLVEGVAEVLVTPRADYIEVARRWTRALLDAYEDVDSTGAQLQAAAADIDAMLTQP
jgi:multiple sugar transport system substrate-binding protein